MMKKTGIVIIFIIVIIVGFVLAFPLLFKDSLRIEAQKTLNKQLNAQVTFSDFNLSLLKSFPKVSLQMKNVLLVSEDHFDKDTLFFVPEMSSGVALFSMFKKSGLIINDVNLENPVLNLISDGELANWDISSEVGSSESDNETMAKNQSSETEESFQIKLEKININNATFSYLDVQSEMKISSQNINLELGGELYGSTAKLNISGDINNFLLQYAGINYISNLGIKTRSVLKVDYDKMHFEWEENELFLNELPLLLSGNFEAPSDSMFFDLKLNSKTSDFENFVALMPEAYQKYLSDFEASGSANVAGNISGWYFAENYPSFSMQMNVENGSLKHKDLPEEISNINANIDVSKKQGELNLTAVNINDARIQIKDNPLDFMLEMNNLVEDPYFDGSFVGKIDFNDMKDVLPLDSVNISGQMDANLFVKGNYSAVQNEMYDDISTNGIILLRNFMYDSPALTQIVEIENGQLQFSSKSIELTGLTTKIGSSNFSLSGKLSNYLNYYFNDADLKGELLLNSRFVNLNEILLLQKQEADSIHSVQREVADNVSDTAAVKSKIRAIKIPDNIDLSFKSEISNAVLDRISITNINGLITIQNGQLFLNGLKMNMLEGVLNLSGMYVSNPQNQPKFNFAFSIIDFDMPAAYRSLSGFRRMLPGAQQSSGTLNSGFQLSGQFAEDLKIFPTTLNGNGFLQSDNLEIKNSPVFQQLNGILKAEKLKDIQVDDFKANFNVNNGNLLIKPFKTKIAGQETEVKGSLNAENFMNVRLDFQVERDALGTDIQSILNAIPGNKKLSKIPASVVIKGPVGKAEVNVDLDETKKAITNAAKDDLQNSLDKIGKGLLKLFEK